MERRKDSKGKVLKDGESQRKDGRYQYRWTDKLGNRKVIYAKDLRLLREREEEIQGAIKNEDVVLSQAITLNELLEKYFFVHKSSLKTKTSDRIKYFLNVIKKTPIGNTPIDSIKQSDAKIFLKSMYEEGKCYGTVNNYKSLIKPAFDMACEDGTLSKNPFDFKLSKIIQRDNTEKITISDEQYDRLLMFVEETKRYERYYYLIIVLYETGLRVGELCGLTVKDIDLKNKKVQVTHQMQERIDGTRFIETPKTKKGERVIPMTPDAYKAFSFLVKEVSKRKLNPIVDGHSGFLFVNQNGQTMAPYGISLSFRNIIAAYNKTVEESKKLPKITPHTFRHTFCTRLILSGMDVKSVQYIMGHSTLNTTLSVYTHVKELDALKEFDLKVNGRKFG